MMRAAKLPHIAQATKTPLPPPMPRAFPKIRPIGYDGDGLPCIFAAMGPSIAADMALTDRDARLMDLSVVVPVRNEAENIAPLVAEIRAALDGNLDYEIIYVDDGSSDDTVQRLRRAAAEFPRLHVIRHARSCGQSAALWTGARRARAPWIGTLDGDGQNDPADLLRLWREARVAEAPAGLALVMGQRAERHDSWWRRVASRVANGVRARLLRDNTRDTGCGLKILRREAYLAMPYFDHMHRFLPALARRHGGEVIWLPVSHRPRRAGQSKYGVFDRLWVGIVDLFGVLWLLRRANTPHIIEDDPS
jgi:dolichol-phosphate mannosyltransferase